MNLKDWFKNQLTAAAVALSNVEKNTFNQQGKSLDTDNKHEKRHEEGTLAFNLKQGEVTQEVKDLRWRTYKILKATEGLKLKVKSMNSDGSFNFDAVNTQDHSYLLNKIKLDNFDDYKLEMVVDNSEIILDGTNAMDNEYIKIFDDVIKITGSTGDEIAQHGSINSMEYFTKNKGERPIRIEREPFPRFYLENFCTKMNVRCINETEKLLEFYVSKYPNNQNPNSRLFVNQIKKAIENNITLNFLQIKEVGFITSNTIGSSDFLCYSYEVLELDKIIEFDGHYVIKYKAKVIINGDDILIEYIEEDLEKRYENKTVKN